MTFFPMSFMALSLLGPMGEPTTIWVTPVDKSSSILALQSAGAPDMEKASVILGVTPSIAPLKSNREIASDMALASSIPMPCLSSTFSGDPATMKAFAAHGLFGLGRNSGGAVLHGEPADAVFAGAIRDVVFDFAPGG